MIALALFVTRRISESSFIGRLCWRTFSSPDMKQNPEKYASALQVTLHKVISVPSDAAEGRGARDQAGLAENLEAHRSTLTLCQDAMRLHPDRLSRVPDPSGKGDRGTRDDQPHAKDRSKAKTM